MLVGGACHGLQMTTNRLRVVFVVDREASSNVGATSPAPYPAWGLVAEQLLRRLQNLDERIEGEVIDQAEETSSVDTAVVALGAQRIGQSLLEGLCLLADETCSPEVRSAAFVGTSNDISLVPWSRAASCQRALAASTKLLNRKSTEDACFAVLLTLNKFAQVPLVATDINPSWEKGWRNVREFKKMIDCCGPQIFAALTDPQTKKAIDLLNSLDLRDQVGSYRVIVSNETPQLEAFSLCILQQNNCFGADAQIIQRPVVAPLPSWRGRTLDQAASSEIFCGHRERLGWSWKVVCGANPAYDAFPMQHQIFYPMARGDGLWYDPVFLVETLDGELVWTKRHYRCAPRDKTPGLWTLTTLDNGIISNEHWTQIACADDLDWSVFYYSGAAKNAGQSYQGALLCSADGRWPASAAPGTPGFDDVRAAFRHCGLELFELYGHGPDASFMWADHFLRFADEHPPPLDLVGDLSISTWRAQQQQQQQ